jgi:hypothetical protein
MTIHHDTRNARYIVGTHVITYDPSEGFQAQREAWQFALECEAEQDADARRAYRDELTAQGAAADAHADAADVEAWLREQPSDLSLARIEVCAVSGDHLVLDQFGRVLKRECDGAAAYLWLREAQQLTAQPVAA